MGDPFEPLATAATSDDWEKGAAASLRGKPLETLASRTEDGIEIAPVYGRPSAPAAISGIGARPPLVVPLIAEPSAESANAAILAELEGGAGGFVLQMAADGQPGLPMRPGAIEAVLQDVHLDAALVALRPGPDGLDAVSELIRLAGERPHPAGIRAGMDPFASALTGGVSSDPALADDAAALSVRALAAGNATLFATSGRTAHEAGATEAQELAAMLASGVASLRALEAAGIAPETAAPLVSLDLAADADLFVATAKLRAARRLWAGVLSACGAGRASSPMHVTTSARMMAETDAYTNMLRTTAAALAAAFGGADSVTVLPFTHALGRPDGFARRIARNTQIVLAEESYIGAVADPALGSGYIEHLTDGFCAAAWSLFQEVEAAGGAASAAGAIALASPMAEARARRRAAIADGARTRVGVNAYSNPDDRPPNVEAWT